MEKREYKFEACRTRAHAECTRAFIDRDRRDDREYRAVCSCQCHVQPTLFAELAPQTSRQRSLF